MLGHRVAQRSYPQGKSAAMKWVIIIEIWYNSPEHQSRAAR
jgi:hypothetical protein